MSDRCNNCDIAQVALAGLESEINTLRIKLTSEQRVCNLFDEMSGRQESTIVDMAQKMDATTRALTQEIASNGHLQEVVLYLQQQVGYERRQKDLTMQMNAQLVGQYEREMKELRDLLSKLEEQVFPVINE